MTEQSLYDEAKAKEWAYRLKIVGHPTRLKILLALAASDILRPEKEAK